MGFIIGGIVLFLIVKFAWKFITQPFSQAGVNMSFVNSILFVLFVVWLISQCAGS